LERPYGVNRLEVFKMITRQDAIKRLEDVAGEIDRIKEALEEGWDETTPKDQTQAFLEKCQGWEDTRRPEEIVADLYAARTPSNRAAAMFNEDPL
jgi:hypothetical protein